MFMLLWLSRVSRLSTFGWRYLSKAPCLVRPRLFYVFLVVSRITIICCMIRQF